MSNGFGFGKTTKDRVSAIRPDAPKADNVPLETVDAIAEAHGFKSREAAAKGPAVKDSERIGRRGARDTTPKTALHINAPNSVAMPFIRFCEENRYSYWEAIEELLRRAKAL